MKLKLCAPLLYAKIDIKNDDFCPKLSKNEEYLQCFELNPLQSDSIEPIRGQFLGQPVFIGHKIAENKKIEEKEAVSLPQGLYLLVQKRSTQALNRSEWLDMAVEQKKDGLWERNKLGNLLYVRYLYEDEAYVTQVFRPAEN